MPGCRDENVLFCHNPNPSHGKRSKRWRRFFLEEFENADAWVIGPNFNPSEDPEGTRTIVEEGYLLEIGSGGMSDLYFDSSTDGITDYVVRSLIHMNGPTSNDNFFSGVGGRRGGEPLTVDHGGFSAMISSGGNVFLTYIDDSFNLEILANVETSIEPVDKDVFAQLDMLGDKLDVTFWELGQPKPAAQISMEVVKPKLEGTLAMLLFTGEEGGSTTFKSYESRPPGDVDGNFVTDLDDLDLLTREISSPGSVSDTSWMDVNSDGVISELDRTYWTTKIVPEPSGWTLILMSGMMIASRRCWSVKSAS